MSYPTRTLLIVVLTLIVGFGVAAVLISPAAGPIPPSDVAQVLIRALIIGLLVGLATAAALVSITTARLDVRLRRMTSTADRYRAGDFSPASIDYGDDELGSVAEAFDDAAQSLVARLAEMMRERAHSGAIFNEMSEGVMLINPSGRLLFSNPALRRMLRLPDSVDGGHYLEALRQPDVNAQIVAALNGTTPAPAEVAIDKSGTSIVAVSALPLPVERGGGALLVLHDITGLRRADQARRDFVANVSHELRTPLTAIRGYVEALLDDAPASPHGREFLEIIARQTSRMERLVRDLLRLARLDAGQEPLERASCPLAAILSAIEAEMAPTLAARHQRLAVTTGLDATSVEADPAKLHDALRNLIENASNYSPEAATIEISTTRVDGSIEIAIADRGPGIPPGDLTRIFERFYRVDRSRSRDPGGTGLGLSIVRHLIELHGGHVSASNRQGGGALLRVRLPA